MAGNPNPKISSVYEGLTVRNGTAAANWSGVVRLVPGRLDAPLHWKKPRMVFVDSMSDLFHESLDFITIGRIFNTMADAYWHTFQVLTKRPERMPEFCHKWMASRGYSFMPKNIWLGTSVENQAMFDRRVPYLDQIGAAVTFLSLEPLLERVNIEPFLYDTMPVPWQTQSGRWVIVGGESGTGARPCALEWIGDVVAQCQDAKVPVFVKQLGSFVVSEHRKDLDGKWAWRAGLKNKKGGDMDEWPEYLRVRQFPEVAHG